MANPIAKLARGLALMLGRSIVTSVNDEGALQLMQVDRLADETADDLERFASYGIASNPPAGAEAIVASLGGVRSHGVVIGVEHRESRLKNLLPGEVALYDDQDQVVYLTRTGIRIETPLPLALISQDSITLDAPDITVTANSLTFNANITSVTGDFEVDGESVLGEGATKFVKLADGSNSTTVKAK